MNVVHSSWVDCQSWKSSWEVIERLGGGGQGEVYRARRSSDGKVGFLKVIKSKNDPERRARFFREASAYDSFGINGIPRLIESNSHRHTEQCCVPYLVTEFIEGVTLRSWLDSQSEVSIESAVQITLRLLDILQACHAQGCVHRDIKPDNIIVEFSDPDRFWLLDFGISYHDLTDIDFQTEDWQEVGNRFLRLPELSAGSRSKQDPRSDICFAAGILFYLLTGEHPDVLEDGEGRLPHQRLNAVTKLHRFGSPMASRLQSFFDDAFETRVVNRFQTVQTIKEGICRMMQNPQIGSSVEDDLVALRNVLDTLANRRLTAKVAKLRDGLHRVQKVFEDVQKSIGDTLAIGQTAWSVTNERGQNTLFWTRHGSTERILVVCYELIPVGEELVLRLSGETVFRTDFENPDYGNAFLKAVQVWLVSRLRVALNDPNALPSEADSFREVKPYGSIKEASTESDRTGRHILAFVYDPSQPERGKLGWALGYFLQNRHTRDVMNGSFVTALVPLSQFAIISDILEHQSMEESRWVLLDQALRPLEQQVIYANAQEAERIMVKLAERYASR